MKRDGTRSGFQIDSLTVSWEQIKIAELPKSILSLFIFQKLLGYVFAERYGLAVFFPAVADVQVAPSCAHLLVWEVRDVEAHFLNICPSWSKAAGLFLSSTLLRSRRQIHHLLFVYSSIMFLLFVFSSHLFSFACFFFGVFLVHPACGKSGYIYAFRVSIGNWCWYWTDASERLMELALMFSCSLWSVFEGINKNSHTYIQ